MISAAVNRNDRPLYIVDGHSAYGVSGGSLWRWTEQNQWQVIGIMSGYSRAEEGFPGFCVFEPIQPVTHYLDVANKKLRAELKARENQ